MIPLIIKSIADQEYALQGILNFDTILLVDTLGKQLIKNNTAIHFNLRDVSTSDSAGLALLIDWFRFAKQVNKTIKFSHLPAQMLAIAKLTGVDKILSI